MAVYMAERQATGKRVPRHWLLLLKVGSEHNATLQEVLLRKIVAWLVMDRRKEDKCARGVDVPSSSPASSTDGRAPCSRPTGIVDNINDDALLERKKTKTTNNGTDANSIYEDDEMSLLSRRRHHLQKLLRSEREHRDRLEKRIKFACKALFFAEKLHPNFLPPGRHEANVGAGAENAEVDESGPVAVDGGAAVAMETLVSDVATRENGEGAEDDGKEQRAMSGAERRAARNAAERAQVLELLEYLVAESGLSVEGDPWWEQIFEAANKGAPNEAPVVAGAATNAADSLDARDDHVVSVTTAPSPAVVEEQRPALPAKATPPEVMDGSAPKDVREVVFYLILRALHRRCVETRKRKKHYYSFVPRTFVPREVLHTAALLLTRIIVATAKSELELETAVLLNVALERSLVGWLHVLKGEGAFSFGSVAVGGKAKSKGGKGHGVARDKGARDEATVNMHGRPKGAGTKGKHFFGQTGKSWGAKKGWSAPSSGKNSDSVQRYQYWDAAPSNFAVDNGSQTSLQSSSWGKAHVVAQPDAYGSTKNSDYGKSKKPQKHQGAKKGQKQLTSGAINESYYSDLGAAGAPILESCLSAVQHVVDTGLQSWLKMELKVVDLDEREVALPPSGVDEVQRVRERVLAAITRSSWEWRAEASHVGRRDALARIAASAGYLSYGVPNPEVERVFFFFEDGVYISFTPEQLVKKVPIPGEKKVIAYLGSLDRKQAAGAEDPRREAEQGVVAEGKAWSSSPFSKKGAAGAGKGASQALKDAGKGGTSTFRNVRAVIEEVISVATASKKGLTATGAAASSTTTASQHQIQTVALFLDESGACLNTAAFFHSRDHRNNPRPGDHHFETTAFHPDRCLVFLGAVRDVTKPEAKLVKAELKKRNIPHVTAQLGSNAEFTSKIIDVLLALNAYRTLAGGLAKLLRDEGAAYATSGGSGEAGRKGSAKPAQGGGRAGSKGIAKSGNLMKESTTGSSSLNFVLALRDARTQPDALHWMQRACISHLWRSHGQSEAKNMIFFVFEVVAPSIAGSSSSSTISAASEKKAVVCSWRLSSALVSCMNRQHKAAPSEENFFLMQLKCAAVNMKMNCSSDSSRYHPAAAGGAAFLRDRFEFAFAQGQIGVRGDWRKKADQLEVRDEDAQDAAEGAAVFRLGKYSGDAILEEQAAALQLPRGAGGGTAGCADDRDRRPPTVVVLDISVSGSCEQTPAGLDERELQLLQPTPEPVPAARPTADGRVSVFALLHTEMHGRRAADLLQSGWQTTAGAGDVSFKYFRMPLMSHHGAIALLNVTPKGAGEGGTLQKLSADADALGIYIKHLPARYTPVIAMNVLFANSRCLEDPEFMRLVREADPNYGLPNAEMKLASPPHEQQDRGPQLHKKVSKDSSAGSPAALASDDGAPSVEHAAGTRLPLQHHPQQRKLSPSARSDEFLPPASDEAEIRYEQDCAAWWRSLIKACDFEEKPSNQQAVWPRDAQRAKVTSQWLDRNSPLYVPHLIVGQWSHLVARNPCPLTALGSDLHPIVRRILSVFTLNRCASLTAVRNVGFAFACMRTRPLLNRWAELMQQAQYAPWSEKKLILGLSRYASLEEMIRHFRESGTMENPSSFWFDKPKEHLREFVRANIRFWTPQPNRGGGKAGGDRGGENRRMKPGGGPPLYQQNFISSREQNHNRAQALLDGRSAYDQQRGGARHVSDRYKEEYQRNYSYNGGRHQSREESGSRGQGMRHITGRNYRDGYSRRDRTEGALRDCGRFGGSLDYERERFAPSLGRDNYYRNGSGRGRGCSFSDAEANDDGYNWADDERPGLWR
eukprot:g18114.t1